MPLHVRCECTVPMPGECTCTCICKFSGNSVLRALNYLKNLCCCKLPDNSCGVAQAFTFKGFKNPFKSCYPCGEADVDGEQNIPNPNAPAPMEETSQEPPSDSDPPPVEMENTPEEDPSSSAEESVGVEATLNINTQGSSAPKITAFLFVPQESDIEHHGNLKIEHYDNPNCWKITTLEEGPRSRKVAELLEVWSLDISVTIKLSDLSRRTTYAAYLIFKINNAANPQGLNRSQKATVEMRPYYYREKLVCVDPEQSRRGVGLPVRRSDGWMELELGRFDRGDGAGDTLLVSLKDTDTGYAKRGLIVAAIEVRPTKQAAATYDMAVTLSELPE